MVGKQTIFDSKTFKSRPAFPMNSRDALVHFSKFINEYESNEILEYDIIYYLNTQKAYSPTGLTNNGYDNNKAEYICELHDHISYRFEIKRRIGFGSFG